jgi:hypothetical protein
MNRVKKIKQSNRSIKRTKALTSILENKGKNKFQSLKNAGYSINYAKNPKQFLETDAVKKELNFLEYETEQIKKRLEKTRNKAKYKELTDSYLGFKKLSQLIGGNPTERLQITAKEREEVDEAFNNN